MPADKMLKQDVQKWNQLHVDKSLQKTGVAWHFNAPYASHFAKSQRKCEGMIESQYCITILEVFYCNFATKLTPFIRKMLIRSTQRRGKNF